MRRLALALMLVVASPAAGEPARHHSEPSIKKLGSLVMHTELSPFKIDRDSRVFLIEDRANFDVSGTMSQHAQLREEVREILGQKLSIVSSKSEGRFIAEVRVAVGEFPSFRAVHNSQGSAPSGFVLVAACRYPIRKVELDCFNTTFYFFNSEAAAKAWVDQFVE